MQPLTEHLRPSILVVSGHTGHMCVPLHIEHSLESKQFHRAGIWTCSIASTPLPTQVVQAEGRAHQGRLPAYCRDVRTVYFFKKICYVLCPHCWGL